MTSANPEHHRSFGLSKRFRATVLSPFILGIFRHPGDLGAAPHTLFRTARHRSTFPALSSDVRTLAPPTFGNTHIWL